MNKTPSNSGLGPDQQMRGGLRQYGDGRVVSSDHHVLIRNDGEFIKPLREARHHRGHADDVFWNRAAPLDYHGVEIKRNTRLYHTKWEEHLRAESLDLDKKGVPYVRFRVVDSYPKRTVELPGAYLDEWIDNGTLKSDEQIHDEVVEELWNGEAP